MDYLCLDFEGVLIPEIWQEVSKVTGIKDLMLTTQDLESYEELMDIRLKLVSDNDITINDIIEIVEEMESGELPLETSLKKFEQGIKLIRDSQTALKQAEQKVNKLVALQEEAETIEFETDDDYDDDDE